MLWTTFTADHVKARMSDREVEVYQDTAEIQEVGEDPKVRMDQAVYQVCERFRGAIRANPQVLAMGPAGTLPTFLLFSAGVIARTFLIAMPVTQEGMTDPRKTENDSAETELKAVRTMNGAAFAIDEPAPAGDSGCYAYGGDRRLGF